MSSYAIPIRHGANYMRPLRWKSRYQTGDAEIDRRNRAFVDCLNSLINAAGQREHCREMEDFIARFSAQAEQVLQDHATDRDLNAEFGPRLRSSLPLTTYGSSSCRQCGLCDLAHQKIAEHLEAPAQCLFKPS
jgi:hypothetical protein